MYQISVRSKLSWLDCLSLTQALVGQRYGAKELPTTIPAADFVRIRTALTSRRSRDLKHAVPLLDACYELDENSAEPDRVYLLTNRNSVSSLQSVDPADVSTFCASERYEVIVRFMLRQI